MNRPVRVRFAPSPTGPLHIGGVRTALFNYLFARQHGGKFILRIEDTDSTRYVPGAEEYIFQSLEWCGLTVDEGVREGGPFAPYRQSDRKEIYWKYAQRLVDAGWAYYAFDTPESLEALRAEAEKKGESFAYGPHTREGLRNSLTLCPAEVDELLATTTDWVIRFKIPRGETIFMHDLIRGDIHVLSETLDDKVLYKRADQLPTYHLANIVDDYEMQISHVIRGEEWLPSLPLHYLLYRAFGWSDVQPEFAHLPLILKPSGNGKLSKRDGDKLGFPVFPLEWKAPATGEVSHGYREDGYLPEAFLNMLAFLGWNPGDEQEFLPLEALIAKFSLERVSKSGARFDPEKAKWFNHQHLAEAAPETLLPYFQTECAKQGVEIAPERALAAIALVKNRLNFTQDLWTETDYFWVAPTGYDEKAVKKHTPAELLPHLEAIAESLRSLPTFTTETVDAALKAYIEAHGLPMGKVMNSLRLALVGASRGIHVGEMIAFLGAAESLERIAKYRGAVATAN